MKDIDECSRNHAPRSLTTRWSLLCLTMWPGFADGLRLLPLLKFSLLCKSLTTTSSIVKDSWVRATVEIHWQVPFEGEWIRIWSALVLGTDSLGFWEVPRWHGRANWRPHLQMDNLLLKISVLSQGWCSLSLKTWMSCFFRYVEPQALTFYTAMGQGSQVTVDECVAYLVFQLSPASVPVSFMKASLQTFARQRREIVLTWNCSNVIIDIV